MKNNTLLLSLVLLVFAVFPGCDKVKEFTYFSFNESVEFAVPAAPVPGLASIPTVPVTSNAALAFENNNVKPDYVENISLEEIVLGIKSPEGRNFDFLNSIDVFIKAPGVQEKKLAFKHNIPEGAKSIDLETTGIEVDPYLKGDTYSLRIKSVTDEVLTEKVEIEGDIKFRVRAKVL